MANELKEKQQKLKKVRVRNIVLNLVCICLAGSGLWWTATYFWRYVNYEVTNDAFVDQYVAPLNVRASGYIKEVRFKEHQYVRQGDTLLVLDNREYQIKVKEAEAALLDAHGSQDVLHSGIETSHTNIAVQDANIAEAKAKLWQLEQDYHRFERLLKEESVPEQQYEQTKAAYEAAKARYQELCHYARDKKVRVLIETCGLLSDSVKMAQFIAGADEETRGVFGISSIHTVTARKHQNRPWQIWEKRSVTFM